MISIHSVLLGASVTFAVFLVWSMLSRPVCYLRIFFRDRTGEKMRYDVTFAGAKETGFIPIELMERVLNEAGFDGASIDGVSMIYSREIVRKS